MKSRYVSLYHPGEKFAHCPDVRELGFSSEFISLLDADKRASSLTTLNKIAAYLKKDLGYFLQEKEGASPRSRAHSGKREILM